MDKIFFLDTKEGINISYQQLVDNLKTECTYTPYCKSSSFYAVFRNIILSLLIDEEIILLDADFTDEEVLKLVGNENKLKFCKDISIDNGLTVDTLLDEIVKPKKNWRITLFTSGTTGLPKHVSHTFDSITRFVKKSERHKNDVWGFAYNPTHMAGLQVFFQALLNRNMIVRLFGLDRKSIIQNIQSFDITNISATPTFYRLLLPPDTVCNSVVRITSGGEKFDEHTLLELKQMFPEAKFTNVYASTEAGSLFASKGNDFIIKDEIKDKVKIEKNELFIHKSLMGESESLKFTGEWYATGDLIEIVCDNPLTFHFISRKNEMINVGGYKVNPTEVEETIRLCPGVQDVFVYAKANRILGNIVCCNIVKLDDNLTELSIREFLRNKLQEFKIPRMMKFVDKIQTTRTGKISRS